MIKNLNCDLLDIAYLTPDEFITSDQIEQDLSTVYDRLKLPYGRIEMQTGIKSRGVYHDKLPSDIAAAAAKNLFDKKNVNVEDIDLLIHASVCRDFLEPSTASMVHQKLQLRPDCASFDLSNACLGVMSAIEVANAMINSGQIKKALVVTGENSKPLLSKTIETLIADEKLTRKTIKKYFANFTIGSAGVALVLGGAGMGIASFKKNATLSDTDANHLCQGSGSTDELVMETDSEALLKRGISLAKTNWDKFCEELDGSIIDHCVCHQVGIQHRNFMYQSLNLDLAKDHTSFDRFGNTGSAALPLTLALGVEENKFKTNDRICLLGIGSGLHTQMTELLWN